MLVFLFLWESISTLSTAFLAPCRSKFYIGVAHVFSAGAQPKGSILAHILGTAKSLPSLDSSGPAFLPLKRYAPVYFLTTFALFARFHAYLFREEFSNIKIDQRNFSVSAAGCRVDFAKSIVLIGLMPRRYISARYSTRALLTGCARSLCRPVLIINHRLAWE